MNYVGIDIAKRFHFASVIDEKGKVVVRPFKFSNTHEGFKKFLEKISPFQEVTIAMEATGHYWVNLYEQLKAKNLEVVALNPLQVSAFRNHEIRGSKTDEIDAVLIAKVLRFGVNIETQLPNDTVLALRQLCRWRADLVKQMIRSRLKLISVLDQVFPEFQTVFKDICVNSAREVLAEASTPDEILKADYNKLLKIIKKASRSVFGKEKTSELVEAAKNSFGIKTSREVFGFQIKLIVEQINHLKNQTKQLDKKIKSIYMKTDCKLTSIPGINYKTAAAIVAEIGTDIKKFKHKKDGAIALVAFAGFDPKINQSGNSNFPSKMSKRGSPYLRKAIFNAVFVAQQVDPMFKQAYERQKAKGKHHFVVLGHLSKKMCHVIYSVMKNNKEYRPILN